MNKKTLIEQFMMEIKEKYKDTEFRYYYSKFADIHIVWHNNKELESKNDKVDNFIGELIYRIILSNGIYNFSFSHASEGEWN